MIGMAAGAVACALIMSRMSITAGSAVLPILVMLTMTGSLINAVQTTMYALAAHVYPTAIRAGGVGTAVAFGRLGAILVGYAGPWALEYRGSESFFWLMAGALVVTCLSLATVRRHVPASVIRSRVRGSTGSVERPRVRGEGVTTSRLPRLSASSSERLRQATDRDREPRTRGHVWDNPRPHHGRDSCPSQTRLRGSSARATRWRSKGFTHLIPFAAGHEIIRQGIADLTLIRMTPDLHLRPDDRHAAARASWCSRGAAIPASVAAPAARCGRTRLAASARDRGAQPLGDGARLRRRRRGHAVRDLSRLPRLAICPKSTRTSSS